MASDIILNNLFEIAQSEVNEIIYFNDFSNELRNNFKELTNDEYDSALLAINEQVKNGNKLVESFSGRFSISNSIISKAINTVEYEKQQRENYQNITEQNKIGIEDVVITTSILSAMIDNYENLSQDEKDKIIDNLSNVDVDIMGKLLGNIAKDYRDIYSKSGNKNVKQTAIFAGEITDTLKELYDAYENGDIEKIKNFYIEHPDILKQVNSQLKEKGESIIEVNDINNDNSRHLLEETKKPIQEIQQAFNTFFRLERKEGALTPDEIKKFEDLKNMIDKYKLEFPKEYATAKEESKNNEELEAKINKDSDVPKYQLEFLREYDKIKKIPENNKAKESISQNEYLDEIKELPIAFSQYGFEAEEIKNAINQYKLYFENLEDDDLQFLSEQTDKELSDILKEEFEEMEVDSRVGQILKIMSNINYHGKIGEILTNSEKRELFFQELENTTNMDFEKIQSDLESQKDTELIKDSELVEIFRQASVELEVGEITQGREDDIQDNSSLLENEHMDTEYIVNGVKMNIDEQWLQFFQDAQEKGEDLAEAYENYKKEQEVEEIEAKKTEERKEDKAQDEQEQDEVIVEEDGTVKKQAEEETELSVEKIDVEGNEFFDLSGMDTLKKSKKSKRVAVVEKDEDGNLTNIQILKPVEFSKQTELTTHEFKETVSELTTALSIENTHEKENGDEEISQD